VTTFGKLAEWLEQKCDFHKDADKTRWTCYGDLRFTKAFCSRNKLNFEAVKKLLEGTGEFCDCEVLFNCVERISEATFLPAKAEAHL
jgi:hypothetical protein